MSPFLTLSYQTRLAFLFLLVLSVRQPTVITGLSMQILLLFFFCILLNTVESFMPHEKVIIRPRDKPWMTGQIPKAVQKRDRLLKTYSKSVNHRPTSWDSYRVQRNLVVSLVRKAKINYNIKTNQALSDPAISSKKWWCITKSIYGNKCYSAILAFSEGDFFMSDPKGSILGPLLSLLYINDFPLSVSCSTELFADDSVLYRKIASVDDCVEFQDDLLSAASLRSKRFRLVSEQRKTVEWDSRFWPLEK